MENKEKEKIVFGVTPTFKFEFDKFSLIFPQICPRPLMNLPSWYEAPRITLLIFFYLEDLLHCHSVFSCQSKDTFLSSIIS